MTKLDSKIAFPTGTFEIGYVLVEDIPADDTIPEADKSAIIFIGSHDDLNLYQIWYNSENPGVQLRVAYPFTPIVRRLKHGEGPDDNS